MLTEDDWKELPHEPELAFAVLDDRLWAKVEKARQPTYSPAGDRYEKFDEELVAQAEHSYVEAIKGFVDEIDLGVHLPSIDDFDTYNWNVFFADFRGKVVYFRARLGARNKVAFFSRPGEAVTLSDDFREEIHFLLNRIRKIVHASDLDDDKKGAIHTKINDLNNEIDQSKTRLGRFKAVWLDVTEGAGEGCENLEPAVKLLERIAAIFGKARAETDPLQLPPPETPKKLPGPEAE